MKKIHATAIVDPAAELADGVEIGPFCIVGPNVRLAEGVVLRSHVVVSGQTTIGRETQVFPFVTLGEQPQDVKYKGELTRLEIGARNMIREQATIHPGTAVGGGTTRLGDDNMIMINVHIGHDCMVGNHVIIANNTLLAGHVTLEDYVYLAGATAVQQRVRVGESVMLAALSGLTQDAAPFTLVNGWPAKVVKMNRVNLERRGLPAERIDDVERAFRIVFRDNLRAHEAFAKVRAELPNSPEAERMVAFLEKSEHGFARRR
ncbi:MAG TPA: acyl-ACP--UDP-N-acetylglucosamine O-acyltransferase [Myxococcota bacterium]|nr:acyl-ACP--UDP-N-acetylglucosamine O-acyltransferase [Myxococcota bacterium]